MSTSRGEAWWRDFAWEEVAKVNLPTTPNAPLVALKCQSCGAPMKNTYKCEYCGTRYGPALQVQPTLYGKPIDDGIAVMEDQLKRTAKKVAFTIDKNVIADVHPPVFGDFVTKRFKEMLSA